MLKSNRPLGIAVMALLCKYLQCIYRRRVAKPRHGGGGGLRRGGGISRTHRVNGGMRLPSQQSMETVKVEQSMQEGRATWLPRAAGDRCECICRWAATAHGGSMVSVQL